jgi:hypothetical protein
MPEDAYGYWDSGSAPYASRISTASRTSSTASTLQLGALTDVLHGLGIFREDEKLVVIAALLGREVPSLRALRAAEAAELLVALGVPC